jgi:hypothetical protein
MTREEKALTLCADFVAIVTEDCPFGAFDFYNDCSDNCRNQFEECWKVYFLHKAGE